MPDPPALLIVRQRPAPHPELEGLVATLSASFQLDAYGTRQQLLGAGLAQLASGEAARLDAIAAVLRRHGYPCWVVAPPGEIFAPPRLRSLAVGADVIDFHCEGGVLVRLERDTPAVGVLADLSGELAGSQARRLLARNAYLGRGQATVFTPAEVRRAILKGQPVFDCYLLDRQGSVAAALRVLPGRFNPEGLGGRAALGATANLEGVMELIAEYARPFRLHSDFGLSPLPGCRPQPARDDPAGLAGNLEALTRYGWLVASLAEPAAEADATSAAVAAAAGLATAAAMAGVAVSPAALGEAVAGAAAADESSPPAASPAPSPLPPPPERPEPGPALWRALPVVAAFAGGALLAGLGSTDLLRPLVARAVRSGLLPALAAVALCWWAFACLRLKRRIEDTPTSRIRSLAMGLVEVRGRALRRYALVTPMTHSPCAWYRLRKYRRDHRNHWTLVSSHDSGHVPFLLDDGGGRLVVDPAGAAVRARTRQAGYPEGTLRIGAAVDGGADEKWVEEMIYEGTTLYVLGFARPAGDSAPGLHERTLALLRRLKLDPRALRRYDANGDGRIDADEWQAARDAAERQAAAEHLADSGPRQTVVLGKPPRGLPFLIAETHCERELARRYGWGGAFLLVLGVVVAGTALVLFREYFGLY